MVVGIMQEGRKQMMLFWVHSQTLNKLPYYIKNNKFIFDTLWFAQKKERRFPEAI